MIEGRFSYQRPYDLENCHIHPYRSARNHMLNERSVIKEKSFKLPFVFHQVHGYITVKGYIQFELMQIPSSNFNRYQVIICK